MKKIVAATAASVPFLYASNVFAQIDIEPPTQGYKSVGNFITNVLNLAFIIGVLVVLIMLIWGAFEWITSGGDKEAVGKARGRIINALIGLGVLAIAFALARVAGQFLGFPGGFGDLLIPTPAPFQRGIL